MKGYRRDRMFCDVGSIPPTAHALIVVKDFKDKDPDPNDFSKVEWTLEVGHLEPHTVIRGVTQRLYNLGFNCPVVKVEDDKTKAAVNAYQLAFKLKKIGQETGKIADIQADIATRHDKL